MRFGTWLLLGYFKSLPREIEEWALVDGASRIQAMVRIVIPLALPGILSAALFAFTLPWNEFLYSLMFMSQNDVKTIPVGLVQGLANGEAISWGALMAAALVGSLPTALLYAFFADAFAEGITRR